MPPLKVMPPIHPDIPVCSDPNVYMHECPKIPPICSRMPKIVCPPISSRDYRRPAHSTPSSQEWMALVRRIGGCRECLFFLFVPRALSPAIYAEEAVEE